MQAHDTASLMDRLALRIPFSDGVWVVLCSANITIDERFYRYHGNAWILDSDGCNQDRLMNEWISYEPKY